MFGSAAMNLREWATNDPDFRAALANEDRCENTVIKVLGMTWDTQHDMLSTAKILGGQHSVVTKREVLRSIAQFYDPVGLFSPVVMRAKVLMQAIWKLNVDWDSPLPSNIIADWHDIISDLTDASCETVPRYIGPKVHVISIRYELHVFCDASQDGYGAAAYLRQISDDPQYCSVDLIYSRTRVAPIKSTSTPRLELLAALIGARVIKYLKRELPLDISATHLWSDSQCVLGWIRNTEKSYPTFITNRLIEIRQDPDVKFHYVRTTDNPADLPSSGTTLSTVSGNPTWWNGPQWLQQSAEHWPSPTIDEPNTVLLAGEGPAEADTAADAQSTTPCGIEESKYSSFDKLTRVTARVLKFIKLCRGQRQSVCQSHLSTSEIDEARHLWLQYLQRSHYQSEIDAIKCGKKNTLVQNMNLFLENGIIRCQGRLENSSLPFEAKCPVLLPRSHLITTAIINDCHGKVMHGGALHTLSRIRCNYWIPRGRQTVKSVLRKCHLCKKFNGRPFSLPKMAPYPRERVCESKPFTYVGVDYFGPMSVKERDYQKTWVCIFTCMVTRAVHLEMVKTTLQLAWERITADESTLNYASSHCIDWIFIVQLSPWMGGFYERLIGTVKRALRKSIGRLSLNLIQLHTVLLEVEAMVNSRPLVYVSDEIEEILTPAHFLSLSATLSLPQVADDADPEFLNQMSSAGQLLNIWRTGQKRLDGFWKSWKNDYLASLRERQQSELKQFAHSSAQPELGSICLVKDDGPRGMWKLARISELHVSRDGEVRSATVQMPNKKLLQRSLKHLYPLECESPRDHPADPPPTQPASAEEPAPPSRRPVRRAAVRGMGHLLDLQDANLI